MTKDDIKQLLISHKCTFTTIIRSRDPELFRVISSTSGRNFSEKLYRWLHDLDVPPKCSYCGKNPTKFIDIRRGYYTICSKKCASLKNLSAAVECAKSDVTKEKRRNTYLNKYGVKSSLLLPQAISARTKAIEEKFDGNVLANQLVRTKAIATKRKNFVERCLHGNRLSENLVPHFDVNTFAGVNVPVKFTCTKCGTTFVNHLKWGSSPICQVCNPGSEPERSLHSFLREIYTGPIEVHNRTILGGDELDFYLPDKKIAIEFNGLYWHSELAGKSKFYHLQKTEECEKLGIHLVHIFEDEWKTKVNIVKSKLSAMLCPSKRIGARKLTLRSIPPNIKNAFLDTHHIQWHDTCQLSVGAYLNDALVAVATFSKLRRALGHTKSEVGVYELSRFATSIPLVGVLPKMLKWLRSTTDCRKVISYADRRFTSKDHNIYNAVGFTLAGVTPVNYWYFRNGYFERFHRFGFIKSNLQKRLPAFDPKKTEWQNMVDNGWNRIWDCGNLKYELTFDESVE